MVINLLRRNLILFGNKSLRISLPGGSRIWITTFSLAFVFSSLITNFREVRELSFDVFSYAWLFAGLVISCISLVVNSIAWKSLIKWLGHQPQKLDLIVLFLRTNLLKYLPGGVWHFIERLRKLRPHMEMGEALASVLLEPILMVVAALVLVPLGGVHSGLAIGFFLPLLLLTPQCREPLLRRLERMKIKALRKADLSLFRPVQIDQPASIREGYPWKPLLIEIIFLIFRFGGFWCCLSAFSISSSLSLGEWISAFSLAWTVGLIVPAAPGGLGVFEAMLLLILGNHLSEAAFIGSVLSYRIVSATADILMAFISPSLVFKRLFN